MSAPTMPARLILPIDFGEAIHVELTGELPVDVAKMLELARADAYARGRLDELRAVAQEHARLELLGPNWRQQAVADHLAAEQARRDAIAARAEERRVVDNIAAGRHPGYRYRGGPVDWHTGLPAGSACAWLRNKRCRETEATEHTATVTPIRPERMPNIGQEAA